MHIMFNETMTLKFFRLAVHVHLDKNETMT